MVNSELRIQQLGCGLAVGGVCAIIHIWRPDTAPAKTRRDVLDIGEPKP